MARERRMRIVGPVAGLVALALVGWAMSAMNRALNPTPPDIGALANSPVAREADRGSGELTDARLAELRAGLPWAEQLGTAGVDYCLTTRVTHSVAALPQWSPVGCRRVAAAYFAFDGDLQERLAAVDRAVEALHWTAAPPDPAGLAQQAARTRRLPSAAAAAPFAAAPAGSAAPSAEAVAAPLLVNQSYHLAGPHLPVVLSIGVQQAPATEIATRSWSATWLGPTSGDGLLHRNDSTDRVVYYSRQPADLPALVASAGHRYLVAVSLSSDYWTQMPAASRTPAPPAAVPVCHSGSGRCN